MSLRAGNYPGGVSTETQARTDRDALTTGDRLVRVGVVVFFVGALATLVTVAPLFLHTAPFPSVAYLVCMLMGVGFLIAGAGVLLTIAEQRRRARA
ncbi:hypothetical protein AB0M94_31015 [Streptomyces xanthochromogenes]|uniref:hypothetical protein n=1 Tax=Streptomyces TaxID=1883 RepID=UPI001E2D1785|nr:MULTISPECIES: hypothetical protein [Streptomyces]